MSTTVSYKGNTIATVSNDTKTLLTEGKYLEDDITLVDVSGGGAVLTTKNISANGTYNASSDSADGYSQVNVSVPNTYAASDEGKVVSNGALVAQGSDTVTENDTYDTTLINSLTVNVSGGGGLSLADVLQGDAPSGDVSFVATKIIPANAITGRTLLTGLDIDLSNGQYGLARNAITSNGALTQVVLKCTNTQNQAPRFESYSMTSCNSCVRIIERGYSGGHDNNVFRGNSALKVFDMQNFYNAHWLNAISENMFYGASGFDTLILRMDSIPSCRGTSAFSNTKFASGQTGGTIYIPEALYNHLGDGTSLDYKNATGWSAVDSGCVVTWAKLEGSPYESLTWYET